MTDLMNVQSAPYPAALDQLVGRLRYRRDRGWLVFLADQIRDPGTADQVNTQGLTLVVVRKGPDSYHPEQTLTVSHYFEVPCATYDQRSWQRWLFDQLGKVDDHERMEDFALAAADGSGTLTRPYAPSHGPGNDPYMIREAGTETDRRTSYLGAVNPA